MKEITTYYAEGIGRPFYSKEDCERVETELKERQKYWAENSSAAKFDKLTHDLKEAMYIHPDTIATCTMESLVIKGMVRVCQKFAEDHKEYLNYY